MGILSGNPKEEPLHYGDVFGLWTCFLADKSAVAAYQTMLNHTGDEDLRKFLRDKLSYIENDKIPPVEKLLKTHGVGLILQPTGSSTVGSTRTNGRFPIGAMLKSL